MATKKQIAANRRNSKLCRGPQTPAGKARSSMNALRHGLRALTAVLPNENQADYNQIHAAFQALYQPQDVAEQGLVDAAANAQWKLRRADAYERTCYDECQSDLQRVDLFARLTLVTCRLNRDFIKVCNELERIKAARPKPVEAPVEVPKTAAKPASQPAEVPSPIPFPPQSESSTIHAVSHRTG